MKRFKTFPLVQQILEESPETRDDDYLLWLCVIQKFTAEHNITDVSKYMSVGAFLAAVKYMGIPLYETVSRERRKVQEKYPELRATAETQAARSDLELKYRKFTNNY